MKCPASGLPPRICYALECAAKLSLVLIQEMNMRELKPAYTLVKVYSSSSKPFQLDISQVSTPRTFTAFSEAEVRQIAAGELREMARKLEKLAVEITQGKSF
jgi:hypothetical protein